MHTLLRQPRLRWLGHVHGMDDGRIPKDLLYGELAKKRSVWSGDRNFVTRMCVERNMKSTGLNVGTWKALLANDRKTWRAEMRESTPS